MRRLLLMLSSTICLTATAIAQNIKEIKVTALEAYIQHCEHPLIINFWATFCAPCVKEIPYFQSTAAKYKQAGVELLLVSLDLPDAYPGKIGAFAQQHHYTVPIRWLDETNAGYFFRGIDPKWSGGMPATLFINNKTHYHQFFDRQLTDLQVEPAIKAMLAPSQP